MEQISPNIRKFLEESFNNETNGLINYLTIIKIDKKYELKLNIDQNKYYGDNKLGPRSVRTKCLDTFIFTELYNNKNLPFDRIVEIINLRIQKNNKYKEFSIEN